MGEPLHPVEDQLGLPGGARGPGCREGREAQMGLLEEEEARYVESGFGSDELRHALGAGVTSRVGAIC